MAGNEQTFQPLYSFHIEGDNFDADDDRSVSDASEDSDDEMQDSRPASLEQTGSEAPAQSVKKWTTRKNVNVNWDSDDEIIWHMKTAGYKDEPVRQRLIKEGRIEYDVRTIATRYSRMKKVRAEHDEQTLDDAFSDYHDEDDLMLKGSILDTQDEYDKEVEAANVRRWQRVAEEMEKRLGRAKWTKNTTRQRYESLRDGTAMCTTENDPDTTSRAAQSMRSRIARQEATEMKREMEYQTAVIEKKDKAERKQAAAKIKQHRDKKSAYKREARLKEKEEKKALRLARQREKEQEAAQKAANTVNHAIERDSKRRAKSDDRAHFKWQKESEKAQRSEQKAAARLAQIQSKAAAEAAAVAQLVEDNARRELIRRHFREAGQDIGAPRAAASPSV